ncbi:MAG TPA: GNAT family N-acetyltransferase [Acidimicrobiales bacterium]|nr:GNAT family N-acetyltransferase [Acidimicrobiales bacterium]
MNFTCMCGATIEGDDMASLGDTFIAHVRSAHTDWPYPDRAVRNFAEATQRLTGSTERLDAIGEVEVHPVTADRLDDWATFFDHDAFADNPAWAACYCHEPHVSSPGDTEGEDAPWHERRARMLEMLGDGRSVGYLAYVDGKPAGWVNASKRSDYALYRLGGGADPADSDVAGISCFVIAPPYRRHGLAQRLLERVIADAPGRGVTYVEAYPPTEAREGDSGNFRGPVSMYEALGFEPLEQRGPNTVMRLKV